MRFAFGIDMEDPPPHRAFFAGNNQKNSWRRLGNSSFRDDRFTQPSQGPADLSPARKRPVGHHMRTPGVEPGSQAWEACMIPLHYVRFGKGNPNAVTIAFNTTKAGVDAMDRLFDWT